MQKPQAHVGTRAFVLIALLASLALCHFTQADGDGRITVNTADLAIGYTTQTDWVTGFTGEISITNRGSQRINNWRLEFDFDRSIVQIWNARVVSLTGTRYVVEGLSYDSFIDPGAKVTFGFNGSPGSVTVPPRNYRLTADAPPPPPSTSGGVTLKYRTTSDWGSGFVGEVSIKNTGTQEINGWQVSFDLKRTLSNWWNAVPVQSQNGHFVFGAASYNGSIVPGQEITFGFQGAPGNVAGVANLTFAAGGSGGGGGTGGGGTPAPPRQGFLHTAGARIVDQDGKTVRLTGLSWFGMETSTFAPHGLWTRSMDSMLDQIAGLGYNCLRVPFCNQLFDAGSVPNGIDFNLNPDLASKRGIEIMDALIAKAGARGIKVILDRHRPDANSQSELWYTIQYSEARWIADWVMLAKRYQGSPTVVGFDLHNEPHGAATWGDGNTATDWRLAAQRAGDQVLAVNPNLLILVEGIERAGGKSYWWGGNLKQAGSQPVMLNVANQLVYSTHDYPTSVYWQPWFNDLTYPANLRPLWDEFWGYLIKNDTAPVLLGEFGTFNQTTIDRQWFTTMAGYLKDTGASFTYWSWNPNSGDTGGLLMDDWRTIHADKQAVLAPLLGPKIP